MIKLNKKSFVKESLTIALNTDTQRLIKEGINIISLGAGELDFETPAAIQNEVKKELRKNKYTPSLGLPELREKISARVKARSGWNITYKNVAVTAGAKQGLYEVFELLLNKGDEVIIPVPAWVSYEEQVKLAGGKPVFAPLDPDYNLAPKEIAKKLSSKTKAIIINSPHNPTGKIFSSRALRELNSLIAGRNICVISDEIYSGLAFAGNTKPASYILDKENLILIDGFSKSHALTGWRIGYVVAPENAVKALGAFQSHASGNASIVSQFAAISSLKHANITPGFARALKKRLGIAIEELKKIKAIKYAKPDGAFYCFIDISKIETNAMRFCLRLLNEYHVAAVPGEAFHAPGYVRISFAGSDKNVREGIRRIGELIKNY